MNRTTIVVFCFLPLLSSFAAAQARPFPGSDMEQIYQRLLPQIEKIPMFDHHAHPGYADDPDVDAMAAPPGSAALRERDTNPELVAAAKAVWGYPYNDLSPEHTRWLIQKKEEARKQQGIAYFSNLLDKLNIEQGVANRAMMADYLDPKRFVWVFFSDSFMWPFDNQRETARNSDEQVYIPLQEKMLHRWMQQEGITKLPASFDDYLSFVTRTLEDNQKKGAIAQKFEVAYFRSTKFSDPTREQTADIYERFVVGGIPSEQEYRTFQDYVFRYLVREGGRLHLPVHIHSAVGIGDYFNLSESNILNLETVVRDPRYASTTFVMIHGGYPYDRQAIWLAAMKNVYLDTSETEVLLYPSEFKKLLKQWLETFPDKVTFGTDCFPYNQALGAEESYWLGVQSSRTALAAALAEMISEGEVTEAQALQLAHGYLHDNAVGIYQGKVH
ncbi:MAG TPA: amidohydrolase family protein [Terriglobales bacterium]|nr:amidohydrolase family protein [Terriglobales bacterium]HXY15467.1 amidohydrolase family protein [Terriglobales bacterium]